MRSARIAALMGALLLVAAACGGPKEPSAEEIEDDIAAQLEEGGMATETAACVAGVVVDEVGVDELQDVDFSDEEPSEEMQQAIVAAAQSAADECDLAAG